MNAAVDACRWQAGAPPFRYRPRPSDPPRTGRIVSPSKGRGRRAAGWQSSPVATRQATMGESDDELVERMTRGDRAALGFLYERYARDVHRVTYAFTRDAHLSADLVHDVFIEVWRRCTHYQPSRGSVKSWILIRARSRALDRLRSASTKREVTGVEPETVGQSVTPSFESMSLPKALEHVSEEERAILMLGYFEGLTCVEIGERLGIPVGTVKSRTRNAMFKLREYFGEVKQ